MVLGETVDYLAEEFDLGRSEHLREVGQSVSDFGTNGRLSEHSSFTGGRGLSRCHR
jgi:hypothetical protein